MADGQSVLKRTAIADVVCSTQAGIRFNRGHYLKGSHTLSNHAIIEIVNTTKVHRRTDSKSTSLKVLHLIVCLRIKIRSLLHKILSIPVIAFCNLNYLGICRLPKHLKCTIVKANNVSFSVY